ncbi:hypothetical protein NZK32_11030 [Cyanobium sp. FGCU-52]|nr:hypothetical protein [Cyanobium sp. FGCU52]
MSVFSPHLEILPEGPQQLLPSPAGPANEAVLLGNRLALAEEVAVTAIPTMERTCRELVLSGSDGAKRPTMAP